MEKQVWLYQILWGDSTAPLSEKVNESIGFRWVPQGGVATMYSETQKKHLLMQAMIKFKE